MRSLNYLFISLLLCLAFTAIFPLAFAEEGSSGSYSWNPYEGWDVDLDLVSKVGTGLFPMVEVSWTPTPETTMVPVKTPDYWVKLAYYPSGSSSGQPALLAGYVGGKNYNAEVTIAGKKETSDDFQNIITIRPQENGVFVWAVPEKLKDVIFYQATASVAGVPVKSEIVKTTSLSAYTEVPANPEKTPKPVTTIIAASTATSNAVTAGVPVITTLTLTSDTLSPKVGEDVELYGRLTDSNGKGISGMKISIEAPDYGTDFLPLTKAVTGSDGGFSATIKTYEDGVVPVRAVFEGTDSYLASTSNTITFSTLSKEGGYPSF